ncbi:uncharacterized protein G2W53_003585 [Senna tora]|uniref:Uncharacterized protein n=1 Tax=Senna tora TaxID=362788 RepID=A0A834XB07_9FABA|nr:uncharacterized protein G2W53_003585 [Senna tora]
MSNLLSKLMDARAYNVCSLATPSLSNDIEALRVIHPHDFKPKLLSWSMRVCIYMYNNWGMVRRGNGKNFSPRTRLLHPKRITVHSINFFSHHVLLFSIVRPSIPYTLSRYINETTLVNNIQQGPCTQNNPSFTLFLREIPNLVKIAKHNPRQSINYSRGDLRHMNEAEASVSSSDWPHSVWGGDSSGIGLRMDAIVKSSYGSKGLTTSRSVPLLARFPNFHWDCRLSEQRMLEKVIHFKDVLPVKVENNTSPLTTLTPDQGCPFDYPPQALESLSAGSRGSMSSSDGLAGGVCKVSFGGGATSSSSCTSNCIRSGLCGRYTTPSGVWNKGGPPIGLVKKSTSL